MRGLPSTPGNDPVNHGVPGWYLADVLVMRKTPFAIALLAATAFTLAACDDDADQVVPVPVPTVTVTWSDSPAPDPDETKIVPSASPSVSVSVSVKPTDTNQNDVPGDGGR